MGTALRNPGQVIALACDSASVAEGAALFVGASNDTVKLPSGANTREKFVGLAYAAGSTSANKGISIVTNGVFAATASGAITRGDKLVVAAAAGTVASESLTTPADATRIGIAMESVADGERVAVLIGAQPAGRGTVIAFIANGAILANSIVVASTATKVVAPAGADRTKGVVGVALNLCADGDTCYVCVSGYAYVVDSGAGVSVGDHIAIAGSTGLGKTAAPSTGTNDMVVGCALATTAASGNIPVVVNPYVLQG